MSARVHALVLLSVAISCIALLLSACRSGPGAAPEPTHEAAPQASSRAASAPPSSTSAAPKAASPEPTPPPTPASSPALGKIYLQQFGDPLPDQDLAFTLRSIAYYFPNPVVVLPVRELPQDAYYPPRSRYRAEKILDKMAGETPADAQVVVALTTVDISTTKGEYEDWGILGLATVSGRECVISRFRAARGAKNAEHTRQRLAKVVVHEIGHTLGLPHCPEYGCLMEDGKGTVLTTDHELDFCPQCRKTVGEKLLPSNGPLPWDPPAHLPMVAVP